MKLRAKGLWVGIIIGILFALDGLIGTLNCNWNPAEGSVVPDGICSSALMIIYLPYVIPEFLALGLIGDHGPAFLYFGALIEVFFFSFFGFLIGWIIEKISLRKTHVEN